MGSARFVPAGVAAERVQKAVEVGAVSAAQEFAHRGRRPTSATGSPCHDRPASTPMVEPTSENRSARRPQAPHTTTRGTAMRDEIELLRARLVSVPPGQLIGKAATDVEALLAQSWDDIDGSDDGGMRGYKLVGRTEDLHWIPPVLSFRIERHGGFVLGSTRAELQTWAVDLTRNAAEIVGTGRRQLVAMDARLNVTPLAAETAAMILQGCDATRLKWPNPSRVRVLVSEIIPTTNKQTTEGRRQRFAAALEQHLAPNGWRRVRAGTHLVFERIPGTD
jgi:hypothetical protein